MEEEKVDTQTETKSGQQGETDPAYVNARNNESTPGDIKNDGMGGSFSLDDIRRMSRDEVRLNYERIIESLSK